MSKLGEKIKKSLKELSPKQIKATFIQLIGSRATAREIGFGFAVGAFIGVFPTFGLGFIIIAGLAFLMKFNVPAAIFGSFVGSPWTTPFWMAASLGLGHWIFPSKIMLNHESSAAMIWLEKAINYSLEYLLGNLIISLAVSAASYLAVKWSVERYRKLTEKHS